MAAPVHDLEISFDPLSDLTPTWTDVGSRLLEVPSVRMGVDGDLDEMQPGTATFRLDNRDRALEPGYAAGTYFPNVRPLRRIRYLINDGSGFQPQFYGYILSWGPTWPGGMNQEAIITAVDGSVILEMDRLPNLDPPTASTYEEVVLHDLPWGYWTLGDLEGSKMTAAEGLDGVYTGAPTLGRPGMVTGDPGTALLITGDASASEIATVETKDDTFSSRKAYTVEALIKPTVTDAAENNQFVAGPVSLAGNIVFSLYATPGATGNWVLESQNTGAAFFTLDSGVDATVGVVRHVVGTLAGGTMRLYLDGEQVATMSYSGTLPVGNDQQQVAVGGTFDTAFEIQHLAVYEYALSAERVMSHYLAARERGFDAELAGERIAAVADSGLWAETDIDTGHHEVAPLMSHGQSRLEAIKDAVRAEFPPALFYYPGTADPRYLDWDYGDTAPYNTVQVIIGNHGGGEVPFLEIDTTDEDELYNVVTVAREGGLAQTVTDSASEAEFFRRTYDLTGLIHTEDAGCADVAGAILAFHSQPDPPVRVRSVTLTSDNALALAEILERMPGDLIRVKHRPKGGTAIDIVTRIRGRTLSVAPLDGGNRVISATWTLGRGFAAVPQYWHAGTVGFTEAGTTTKAR
jgi:hypothetical protein